MRYKLLGALVVLAVAGTASATLLDVYGTVSGTADVKPAVKIMEVQYNPKDESTQEYVVVKNLANTEVDLSGWKLEDDSGADKMSKFNKSYSTEVGSGERAYITESEGDADLNIALEKSRVRLDDSIGSGGLANSGEEIKIKVDGVVVSKVNYTKADCSTTQSYQRNTYEESFDCESASLGTSGSS